MEEITHALVQNCKSIMEPQWLDGASTGGSGKVEEMSDKGESERPGRQGPVNDILVFNKNSLISPSGMEGADLTWLFALRCTIHWMQINVAK